jgi:hypothetical protein
MSDSDPQQAKAPGTSHFERERAARSAVKATVEKLGPWQVEVALLRGYVTASRLGAAEKSTARRDCRRLTVAFETAEERLLADTPEELRSHGRIRDMQRALQGLKVAVNEVVQRLDREADI